MVRWCGSSPRGFTLLKSENRRRTKRDEGRDIAQRKHRGIFWNFPNTNQCTQPPRRLHCPSAAAPSGRLPARARARSGTRRNKSRQEENVYDASYREVVCSHCRAQVLNSIVCAAGHVEQHDLHWHVRVFGLGRGRLRPSTHSSIRRGRRLAIWLKASVHINLTGAQGPSCSGPTRWTYADRHTNDDQVRPEQAGGRHCRVVLSLASSSRGPCPVPRGSTSVGACIVALI